MESLNENYYFFFFFIVTLQIQDGSLKLIYCQNKTSDLLRAEEELRGLLKYRVIPVESGFDEILSESDWHTLKKKVESGGKLCLLPNVCCKFEKQLFKFLFQL